MANPEHLAILEQGVEKWNRWREANPGIRPDLRDANLSGADLEGAYLSNADLSEATLCGANLRRADFIDADLTEARFRRADLSNARLSGARLARADLRGADLRRAELIAVYLLRADLTRADLSGADLAFAALIGTNLEMATLSGCDIYGIAAWDLRLKGAIQDSLVITPSGQPIVALDNLEVAQFVYLLLNNRTIRDVIDMVGRKAVLILGRFTPERKAILDAIRDALRHHGYLPILFDFEKPVSRDFTSTVETLARLSRFIIADLSDPRSIPQELASVIPHLRTVPVQPILLASQAEYAMFGDYRAYPWVLATHQYTDLTDLLGAFEEKVIGPAEAKAKELTGR